jgi:hypothetical protein
MGETHSTNNRVSCHPEHVIEIGTHLIDARQVLRRRLVESERGLRVVE